MCKVTSKALSSLADEVDVTDVINLYHEFFTTNQDMEAVLLEDQPLIKFGEADGADLGVESESGMSKDDLASNLGFLNGKLLLFNDYRHRAGLSSWTNPEAFVDGSTDLEPLNLFWHQLAGVHAIIRMNFHPTPSSTRVNGTLVADEVGLGKTFQAATVIVFLSDLVMRQSLGKNLPPIISLSFFTVFPQTTELKAMLETNPYLGNNDIIPSYPHLIIVAGTLLSQWESELQTLIKPNSFDIFIYGSGKSFHENFWSSDGPFHSSKHKSNRIIIASYSVHIHNTHRFIQH
jgi:hypothetical protein